MNRSVDELDAVEDVDGDVLAGKRTLATRLGDNGTRMFLTLLMLVTALTG